MTDKIERIGSGIPGLDDKIQGGIPKGFIILYTGAPGTGKTLASIQYLAYASKKGMKCAYFGIEQTVKDLIKQSEQLDQDLSNVKTYSSNDLKYDAMLGKKPQEVDDLIKLLLEMVKKGKYDCVVIDSVSSLEIEDGLKARIRVKKMIDSLKKIGVTVVITGEAVEGEFPDTVTPFLVDGVVLFQALSSIGKRTVTIKKMRQTNHEIIPFAIKIKDKGIVIE